MTPAWRAVCMIALLANVAHASWGEGSYRTLRRGLLQSKCKSISADRQKEIDLAMSKPSHSLPLLYPVYSIDAKKGEMSDACEFVVEEAKWRVQANVPDGYVDSVEQLADIAVVNAALTGCEAQKKVAVDKWYALVMAWAKVKGFTGPANSWSGIARANQGLAATSAGFLKIKTLLTAPQKAAVLSYIKLWDAYAAGIRVSYNVISYRDAKDGKPAPKVPANLLGPPATQDPDGGVYDHHELYRQLGRLLSSLAMGDKLGAALRVDAIINQLSKQLTGGYIISERRCIGTVHNHVLYMETSLVGLSAWKLAKNKLPNTLNKVLPQIDAVIKNLESPQAATIFAKSFKYSDAIVKKMQKSSGVDRLRIMYNFISDTKATTVLPGDCRFVGFLNNMKF